MRILITGDAGFVGRHFHKYFANTNHEVHGVDIVNGVDARDFFRKDDSYFDLVIHLAAVVGGRATIEGSPLAVAVDLAIDSELFQWALRTRPGRIVYFSSSAAYPIQLQTLDAQWRLHETDINLDMVASPDLSYGWSKLTGEKLAVYAQAEGVQVHVFRPFSGYGSDQALDYPFPSFIDRAKRRLDPFEIWSDGLQTRDFIHINDIVNAVMEAIKQDVPGPVNLCSGRATSFNDLAALITEAAGYQPRLKHHLEAPRGVAYRVGDPTKMLSFYTPRIGLEQGIRMALS